MALNYGDYSTSRTREIYQSDIKSVTITAPGGGTEQGAPVYITYVLESDIIATAPNLEMEYSTDSGSNYSTCTPLVTDGDHDGITNLSTSAAGQSHTFVWDSATDVTTSFQSSTVNFRCRADDQQSAFSEYATGPEFTIDMLPAAPDLIDPDTGFFDSDTTPDFTWQIPTDPGSDRIAFCIEVDDSSDFSSVDLDHNSQDDLGRFRHRVSAAISGKQGANTQTFYVRNVVVAAGSTAVTFASLTDFHKESAVDTTLTNPQILLLNKADRRCFIDPSTITGTGFTIQTSAMGVDATGLVDIVIYSGATGVFDTYWVDLTGIAADTAYTYGVAPFDTDLLSQAIPGSITDCRPMILEGNDCPVFIDTVSDTGFTLNLSGAKIDSTATVRVCLRGTPNEAYIHTEKSIAQFTAEALDTDSNLDDSTNGAAAWPDYIPGLVLQSQPNADRLSIYTILNNDGFSVHKSAAGIATNASDDIHAASEPDGSVPYWTDIAPLGVPDSYEGNHARYTVVTGDLLSTGFWSWRVRGANIS